MAPNIPTVMQLYESRLKHDGRTVDLLNKLDPDHIPRLATILLQQADVPLVGPPRLVDFAKRKVMRDVEAIFDLEDAERKVTASRQVGRPRSGYDRDAMFMTAYLKFADQGLGLIGARNAGAKLLGTTVYTVEKGVRRFRKRASFRNEHASPEELHRLRQIDEQLLSLSRALLDRCVEERRAMMRRGRQN